MIGGIKLWSDLGYAIEGSDRRGRRRDHLRGRVRADGGGNAQARGHSGAGSRTSTPRRRGGDRGRRRFVLLDTREPHEYAEAHLEGATLVPPAEVAERIDEVAPDPHQRVIVYCRSRQPLGARRRTSSRRSSATTTSPTSRRHRGVAGEGPAGRRGRGHDPRAARALLPPHAAARGRRRGPDQDAEREGAAARRRRARRSRRRSTWPRPGSARSASSTTTSWTRRTCSAR